MTAGTDFICKHCGFPTQPRFAKNWTLPRSGPLGAGVRRPTSTRSRAAVGGGVGAGAPAAGTARGGTSSHDATTAASSTTHMSPGQSAAPAGMPSSDALWSHSGPTSGSRLLGAATAPSVPAVTDTAALGGAAAAAAGAAVASRRKMAAGAAVVSHRQMAAGAWHARLRASRPAASAAASVPTPPPGPAAAAAAAAAGVVSVVCATNSRTAAASASRPASVGRR